MSYLIRACCLVLVWAIAAVAPVPASAMVGKKVTSGAWDIKAHHNKDSGKFTRCTVQAHYESNIYLAIAFNRNRDLEIWLSNPDWTLDKDASYPVRYWVDGSDVATGTFNTSSLTLGVIDVEDSVYFLDWLKIR